MTMTATPSVSIEAIATPSLSIPFPNDMPKGYGPIDVILFGIASIVITIIMYLRGKDDLSILYKRQFILTKSPH